jgi:hypothetical protein
MIIEIRNKKILQKESVYIMIINNVIKVDDSCNVTKHYSHTSHSRHCLPISVIRKINSKSTNGGRFSCTNCHKSYSTDFATFGKISVFEAPSLYCKDCAKLSGFSKC